jgi:sigma-B regulation protein RsbU (phosphoserine phosphatase)
MFVTLFYGIIDTVSGEVQYVNAGHNPPYVLKADGTVTAMPVSKNVCLGVIEDYPYKSDILKLDKGDCLVTFTDGVTEACSPSEELYGEQRLETLLQTLGGSSTKTIVDSINNAVHQHADGAEQSDDITILCVKRA